VPGNGRRHGHVIVHDAPTPATAAHRLRLCPLLAVCGLCGGAGTSTLAYLLARFAAIVGPGHVLVADTGGPTGGLAAAARVDSGRTLAEAGELLGHGLPLAPPLYATDPGTGNSEHEVRVLATAPRFQASERPEGAGALLTVARHPHAHALVVVDCGTLQRAADRFVARHASHIAWVAPATADGIRRASRVLEVVPTTRARELIVARRDPAQPTPPQRTLNGLTERRRAPLVLLPHVTEPRKRPERAIEAAAVGLQAILGVLGR
jgi:hypothetical protein